MAYGSNGCLSISIPSGNVQLTIKGGRKCYANGFVQINGAYYASCSEKAVLDIVSNGEIRTIALPELCPVLKSIPNSTLVAGSDSGKIYFWNTIDGSLIGTFKPHSKPITCIDFDQSFNTVLTGSMDSSLKLFCQPLVDCKEVAIFYGHLAPIISCANLIKYKYQFDIASISEDSTLKLWKLQRNINRQEAVCIYTINLNSKPHSMLKGLNNHLYVSLQNSTLLKLELQIDVNGENISNMPEKYYNFTQCMQICESCEGYHLVSIGVDGIRIWDTHSITCLSHFHLGSDCNSILMARQMNALVTKCPLKRVETHESHLTLLQMDKESTKKAAIKAQNALKKLLPLHSSLQNLDLSTHLNLYKDSEQLYKLIKSQVIETSKQMESLDAFNDIYNDIK